MAVFFGLTPSAIQRGLSRDAVAALASASARKVWLAMVIASLALTEAIVSVMGMLLRGRITYDFLLTGLVASVLVASLVSGIVLTFAGALRRINGILAESEEKLRGLYELSPLGIALTDMQGRYVEFNEAFRRICGYPESDLKVLDYWALTPEKYRVEEARQLESLKSTGRYGPYEKEYRRRDGSLVPIRLNGVLVAGRNGSRYIWSIVEDISEQKRVETRLKLAASVFEHSLEGIVVADAAANIIDVNRAFTQIMGYSRDEMLGRNVSQFPSTERQGPEFRGFLQETLAREGYWRGELWSRRKNGEEFAAMLTVCCVRGEHRKVTHYIGVFSDITLQKAHEQQLWNMAHYDVLTGLPNRLLLEDRTSHAIRQAERSGKPMALCYLDLDGFKPVNDTWGHDAGDQLLLEMARRLKDCVRGGDTVARLGGDEFVLLLVELAHSQECEAALQRILQAVARPAYCGAQAVKLSASIGVTMCPPDDPDPDNLVRHADQAMYVAKQLGKNRYHIFKPEQDWRQPCCNE